MSRSHSCPAWVQNAVVIASGATECGDDADQVTVSVQAGPADRGRRARLVGPDPADVHQARPAGAALIASLWVARGAGR